jgi:hypothetical protein
MAGKKAARRALKAAKVLEMYAAGKHYNDIVADYEVPRDPETKKKWSAEKLLDWAVSEVMPDSLVKQARNIELQRLQDMHKALWFDALSGDREAVVTVLRLMERRAKLLGLDSAAKVDLDNKLTINVLKFDGDDNAPE